MQTRMDPQDPGPALQGAVGAPPRRLGRHHFAFYRAYLEALPAPDTARLAERHFPLGSDPRRIEALSRWLHHALAQAARQLGDRPGALLLRLPDNALSDPPAGAPRQAQRHASLRRQRLDALARLEAALSEAPRPEHHVSSWFDPPLAERLARAGLDTVGSLAAAIDAHGAQWGATVPHLADKTARRIARWLREHAATTGCAGGAGDAGATPPAPPFRSKIVYLKTGTRRSIAARRRKAMPGCA